ncbi:hypothetical protein FB451DRAFT_1413328 [Mycena latifolia]|nr:hypothetical protein FB451DRAFT_1413328 [Mycena latifolia]
MPHPLTQPRPPVAKRTTRGRAPPVSTTGVGPARVLYSSALGKTTTSGSSIAAAAVAAPDVITHLHKRLTAFDSARSQDAEWLTTRLESEAAALQAEFDTARRARRVLSKKVELDDGRVAAGSSQAVRPLPVRLALASFRASQGASFAREPHRTAGHLLTRILASTHA